MGFENPVVGGTALRLPAIQSPDYVSGSSGWIIKIDGSSEFNNVTVRGTVLSSTIIGGTIETAAPPNARIVLDGSTNQIEAFDATNTQVMTISPTSASINITGSIKVINSALPSFYLFTDGGSLTLNDGVVTNGGRLSISDGSGAVGPAFQLQSPNQTTTGRSEIKLFGQSPDGTVPAFIEVLNDVIVDAGKQINIGSSGSSAAYATNNSSGTNDAFSARVSGDTNSRYTFNHNGFVSWGPGGATAVDTTLNRNAAASLGVGNSVVRVSETWQTPSFGANWSGSTTYTGVTGQTLRYRRDAEDNLWLEGAFKVTGAAGAVVLTLPSGFFDPGTTHFLPVMEHTAAATFFTGGGYVSSAGNFHIDLGAGFTRNVGDEFYVNAKVPLGNVA